MKISGIRQNAKAIYELAQENKSLQNYIELATSIINVFNQNFNLQFFLSSPSVDINEKKKLITDITMGNKYFKNWLFILLEQDKSKHIKEHIEGFIKYYNYKHNIIEGIIWSASPLLESEIEKLAKAANKKLEKNVSLINKIDKEIIGGIKLEIEDNVWDNTLKTKIATLLKEGE